MPFKIIESKFSLTVDSRPNKKALNKIMKATGKILDLLAKELPEDNDIKCTRLRFESETDITEFYKEKNDASN